MEKPGAMSGLAVVPVVKGSKTGQNVNYYYSEYNLAIPYSDSLKASLKYEKEVITPDGTILGFRTFEIIPILEPIPNTSKVIRSQNGAIKKFEEQFDIVDASVIFCNWV